MPSTANLHRYAWTRAANNPDLPGELGRPAWGLLGEAIGDDADLFDGDALLNAESAIDSIMLDDDERVMWCRVTYNPDDMTVFIEPYNRPAVLVAAGKKVSRAG